LCKSLIEHPKSDRFTTVLGPKKFWSSFREAKNLWPHLPAARVKTFEVVDSTSKSLPFLYQNHFLKGKDPDGRRSAPPKFHNRPRKHVGWPTAAINNARLKFQQLPGRERLNTTGLTAETRRRGDSLNRETRETRETREKKH